MFCPKCGKEAINEAVYCYHCGFKLSDITSIQTVEEPMLNSDEIIPTEINEHLRKGTSIYLNRLLQFEFICKKLKEKIDAAELQIQQKEEKLGWKYYPHNKLFNCSQGTLRCTFSNKSTYTVDQNDGCFGFHCTDSMLRTIIYSGNPDVPYPESGCYWIWYDLNIDENMSCFKDDLITEVKRKGLIFSHSEVVVSDTFWNIKGNPVVFGQEIVGNPKYIFSNRSSARSLWLQDFEDYCSCKEQLIAEQMSDIDDLKSCISEIQTEYNKATEILNSLYALNIIPKKFRNLKAMCSICEYYDSSIETLSFILFHLDFDEIMSKLDDVINQQQEIIINQAIQISQNEELMRQNNAILGELEDLTKMSKTNSAYLSQIENNTAKTANWANIAAINAEACAWIGAANHIKD